MSSYHDQTAHTYRSVRMKSHRIDWDNPPKPFKIYPESFPRIMLDAKVPSHRFLMLIGGITAQKSYPGVTYALRTNPSAGALYPTETYVQIRTVEGLEDGIYHLCALENALVRLGDLNENEGVETFLHVKKIKGFVFLFSALYYRSSWKYQTRAFRYCLLDTGHMIGTLEASCLLFKRDYCACYRLDRSRLNTLFAFENEEFFLSSVIVGEEDEALNPQIAALRLMWVDGTGRFEADLRIEEAYRRTCTLQAKEEQRAMPAFAFDRERWKEAIWKRRSIRDFTQKPLSKEQFFETIRFVTEPIPSDCDVRVDLYAVINRVNGMEQGIWREGKYVQKGDFSKYAGYLCLEQALGEESGVTFFIVGEDAQNYQAMMQKAGIIGHRLYLIATYLGFGCSGIGAYYDDEVKAFLQQEGMILYALSIGY